MGHGSGPPAAADQPQPGCRVLPVIEEEPDEQAEGGEASPLEEMTRLVAERRKAIVARMRELLTRAAAAQSAHRNLRRSTVATARKWKRAVGRIQRRGKNHQQVLPAAAALQEQEEEDGMLMSSSSSISSQSSFTWDAAAETCCLSLHADRSPLLWPAAAFVSSTQRAGTTTADQRQASSPATGVLRLSCGSSWSEDDDDMRMAHWDTTDSDFVVLEL